MSELFGYLSSADLRASLLRKIVAFIRKGWNLHFKEGVLHPCLVFLIYEVFGPLLVIGIHFHPEFLAYA